MTWTRQALHAAWLALFPFLLPTQCLVRADGPPPPAPLNVSVMIENERRLEEAPQRVELFAKSGQKRVQIVVTVQCQLDKDRKPLNYGQVHVRDGWRYVPFDDARLAEFRKGLKDVFAKAAELGLDVAVLAHADAEGRVMDWRNHFDLDPLQDCGGYSFKRVLIDAVADALEETVGDDTRVDFALCGEMGRSVFAYPESYLKIMTDLRRRKRLRHLQVGHSLSRDGVSGSYAPDEAHQAAAQKLIAASDFLGVSCYGRLSLPPRAEDFTATVDRFLAEMKLQGVDVPEKMELQFSEVAVGGRVHGLDPKDVGTTKEVEATAKAPYQGTGDPKKNPWTTDLMRGFRRDFHTTLLDFLRTQPAARRVAAAYLWDEGSWDPYGLDNEAFKDEEIIRMIGEYNAKIER